ncbi:MAG: LpqN/LpqT family lipoprotein [Actinomycetota bacterium]|nr:LpqN/LpqT family lipoprotein [Actinomycetota bacterium]
MSITLRAALVLATGTALLVTGCARDIGGTAVPAAGGAAAGGQPDNCRTVDAPLVDIPSSEEDEPRLRIPVPAGWKRNSMMDSQIIRFAIVAEDLTADGFSTNAVVTLESARGSTETPEEIFEQNRDSLVRMMGASDLSVESNTTCGLPSETTDYTAPPMGMAPERPVIMHAVVAEGDITYLATLTIQTTEPDDPDYQRDAQEIVDGFQVLVVP